MSRRSPARYFVPCRFCGANLDPGERCECQDRKRQMETLFKSLVIEEKNGQMRMGGVEDELCAG